MGPRAAAKKRRDFDPRAFLATIGEGRKFVLLPKKQGIYAQGDIADAVFYAGGNDRHNPVAGQFLHE
jgi:hypothetical protein